MNRMKNIFITIFLAFLPLLILAQSNTTLLDSANAAYAKNKFDLSIKYYEQIVSNGYESAEVYYNIGNAYYKNNHLPQAILNYERARKLSPSNEDIIYNLKMANNKLIDKIEPLPQLFIKDWWNSLILACSEKSWSMIYISFVWLGFGGIVIYFTTKRRSVKQLSFIFSIGLFILSFLFLFISRSSHQLNSARNEGIIVTSTVNIKGSPSEQGTNLFILHEGTKVDIEQSNGSWLEVQIPNGNRGWIKAADVAVI